MMTGSIILLVSMVFFVLLGSSQNDSQREVYLLFVETLPLLPNVLVETNNEALANSVCKERLYAERQIIFRWVPIL